MNATAFSAMNCYHTRSVRTFLLPIVAIGLLLAVVPRAGVAQDENATIVLKDGRALEGRVESVSSDSLKWRLPGLPQPQTYRFDQVDYIDFPQPPEWLAVMEQFEDGDFEKAAEAFKGIALQRNGATHYPAPGNFATLAERRLLDCYRRLRKPVEIAYVAKRIEWEKLPVSERNVASIIECWSAVGNGNWEAAEKALADARQKIPDTSPQAAELGYLDGLIAIGQQDPAEASVQFARAYAPDASADAAMAADGLKQAIEQILPDPERRGELRAMVHLYAELHGNGKLWDGAGDFLEKIHAEGFRVGMSLSSSSESAPVMARFVRIERVADTDTAVAFAEVEVWFDEVNIARKGKASQSSDGQIQKRKFKADAAIDGNQSPDLKVGSLSRTATERRPWWELDLGAMSPIERIDIYGHRNQEGNFANPPGEWQIRLLNGSRDEVWSETVPPGDGSKVSVSPASAASNESEGEAKSPPEKAEN